MNLFRSKAFEKHLQVMKNWTQNTDKSSIYQFKYTPTIYIANSIWDDIEI